MFPGASGILRRLRDLGLLQQHPHASMTYYTSTPKLLSPEIAEQKSSDLKSHAHETTLVDYSKDITDQLSGQVPVRSEGLAVNLPVLPTMPGSLPANLKPLPANLKPLPANLKPLPANLKPLPTNLKSLPTNLKPLPTNLKPLPANLKPLPTNLKPLPANLKPLPTNLKSLPANLLEEIRGLGQRSPPGYVQKIIAELCAIRAFTAEELAEILNRNKQWVYRSYITPMIRNGILEYALPENPHHPNQAYRTKK
jgi:hypothetical protein